MYLFYLDPSGDSGWPKPYGKSPHNFYVMSGLAIKPKDWSVINTLLKKLLISYLFCLFILNFCLYLIRFLFFQGLIYDIVDIK
jgi:hypothetical protein